MLTVHHLNNSRSQRVLWLLEELGMPYELRKYERDPVTMLAPASLRAIHPLGKSPVITDGDLTVAESGAIIEYIVGKYGNGRLIPAADTAERLQYTYWLHYAEGSLMPPLLLNLVFGWIAKARMPFFARPVAKAICARTMASFITPQIRAHMAFMEDALTRNRWFAGEEFSAVDIQMSFPIEAAAARAGLNKKYPALMAYLAQIHARPAYQKALETGGPFELFN